MKELIPGGKTVINPFAIGLETGNYSGDHFVFWPFDHCIGPAFILGDSNTIFPFTKHEHKPRIFSSSYPLLHVYGLQKGLEPCFLSNSRLKKKLKCSLKSLLKRTISSTSNLDWNTFIQPIRMNSLIYIDKSWSGWIANYSLDSARPSFRPFGLSLVPEILDLPLKWKIAPHSFASIDPSQKMRIFFKPWGFFIHRSIQFDDFRKEWLN